MRLLEPLGHAVELVGQCLKLVAALHCDPMIERARADARSACTQYLDRRHHPAHQKQACQDRDPDTDDHEDHGPPYGRVQGRKCFGDRHLDEDGPVQRGDGCVRGEDFVAPHVPADHGVHIGACVAARCGGVRPDLGER